MAKNRHANKRIRLLPSLILTAFLIPVLPGSDPAGTEEEKVSPRVSRADFAASYLRFEEALLDLELSPEETARVSREFDSLTLLFFSRNYEQALRRLHRLTASLHPETRDSGPDLAAASLAVRMRPPVYVQGSQPPAISVESLYEWEKNTGDINLAVALRPRAGLDRARSFKPIPFKAAFRTGERISLELPFHIEPSGLKPGQYDLGIMYGNKLYRTGSWNVVREDLEARRLKNNERIAVIRDQLEQPHLLEVLNSVQARNNLLSIEPSPENTAQTVLDLAALAEAVDLEIKMLQKGTNPFKQRPGDTWRVISEDARNVPVRLYAPEAVRSGSELPLVVAFHGAGGDENMFLEGYGAGQIKRLADECGFLVVSPFTNAFAGSKAEVLFDRLLETLSADYKISQREIYLLGHSMGAMVVSRLCQERADRIRAAACLGGFPGFRDTVRSIPPVLVVVGELDPMASPSRIEPLVTKAVELSLPVTYRKVPGFGHTLLVNKELPATLDWLIHNSR